MKNLKKVLSLALVFAMVLGLCIGAMAANTQDVTTLSDWGNVTHKEAAQLLNAFNIMQGYTDKTFRPTNTVTRAEAVKMIDVGLWGGVDQPDRFIGSEKIFSDVKNSDWFAGHVTYAQALGILDGFPDGTFRPNDTVTGYQLLKMVLIALNYNSEVEGLTGAGWDIRTMRLATDPSAGLNLTSGLSAITDWNAPLTRDQAAQIIANMIMHSYVTYNLDRNGQVGNMKSYGDSFGEIFLGLNTVHGVLVANQYGSVTKGFAVDDYLNSYPVSVSLREKVDYLDAKEDTENALIATIVSYPTTEKPAVGYNIVKATVSSTIDDLGTPVTVYTKNNYPVAVAIDDKIEVEPAYDVTFTKVTNADRELGGEAVATALTVGYAYEQKTVGSVKSNVVDAGPFAATTAYDVDGDGRVDFMTTKTYSAPVEVKGITTTNKHGDVYQINTYGWRSGFENSALDSKNFLEVEAAGFTAAKGDIISYNTLVNAYNKVASYGIVLDAVEGKIDRVNTTNPNARYINVDGVQYYLAKGVDAPTFGYEGTAYTYPDSKVGLWVNKTTAPTADKYAVIYDAGWSASGTDTAINDKQSVTVQVSAILDTGDTGVYNVANIIVPNVENSKFVSAQTFEKQKNGSYKAPDYITIPVSAFNSGSIVAKDSAVIGITTVQGGKTTANLTGLFYNVANTADDGILANIDNTVRPDGAKDDSTQTYALVSYTVNEDGSLNITPMASTAISQGTEIAANNPSLGSDTYFKSSTLTFTQTEETRVNGAATGDVVKETWTVVTGLPTTSYKLAQQAEAYLKLYFTDDQNQTDKGAVAFVLTNKDIEAAASTMPFLYVVNNNGITGTEGTDSIYTLDVYNAETNKLEQIEVKNAATVAAGEFYTDYTAATKSLGYEITLSLENKGAVDTQAKLVLTPRVGFISSIADNVIGLTKVTGYENDNNGGVKRTTSTEPYVISKDTKFYLVDGEKTTQVDADEIGVQEVLDWAERAGDTTKGETETVVNGTRYYQTVIIPTMTTAGAATNVAAHVIVFATEQTEAYGADNQPVSSR